MDSGTISRRSKTKQEFFIFQKTNERPRMNKMKFLILTRFQILTPHYIVSLRILKLSVIKSSTRACRVTSIIINRIYMKPDTRPNLSTISLDFKIRRQKF